MKKISEFSLSLACSLVCIAAHAAPDADVIGYVKTSTFDSSVWLDGKATAAQPGLALRRGSVLRSGKQGSIGATFKDSTIVAIGPDSEFAIDDYLYEPGKGDLKFSATVTKGSLYYVPGVIAKLKPDAVSFKTPTGAIEARGSRFLAHVEGGDESVVARAGVTPGVGR
ncbi:hypothetical protein BH09PSE5_BH09PSE5_02700 [soil metagenome]